MKKLKFKKKILAISSSRSDYYLLRNLLKKIESSNRQNLFIVGTGTHNLKKFGHTIKNIKKDNFKNLIKLNTFLKSDSPISIIKNFEKTLFGLSKILIKIKPDLVIILGDRYEMLSAATASSLLNIPIAHIHGGEITHGSQDDNYRHAISKLSHIHFAATKKSKKRLMQLGENKKNIHVVGSLGVENIKNIKFISRKELEKNIKIKFNKKNFLINFHSDTYSKNQNSKNLNELLNSLLSFKDTNLIFTYPNSDQYNGIIIKRLTELSKKNKNCFLIKSLGDINYFSLIKNIDLVIGNSSSGIIEVPSLEKISINIGNRQSGREQAKSIFNCNIKKDDIKKAIKLAMSKKNLFKQKKIKNPYFKKNTSNQIYKILSKTNLKNLVYKKFETIM